MAVAGFAVEGQGALEPWKRFAPALLGVCLASLGEHSIGCYRALRGWRLSQQNRDGRQKEASNYIPCRC